MGHVLDDVDLGYANRPLPFDLSVTMLCSARLACDLRLVGPVRAINQICGYEYFARLPLD